MAINDFIKGGQTFSQNWRMFFNIFWKLVAVFFACGCLTFMGLMYSKTTAYQRYQAFTLVKAEPFSWLFNQIEMRLNRVGLVTLGEPEQDATIDYRFANGVTQKRTVDDVIGLIATPTFMRELHRLVLWNAIEGSLISLLITIVLAAWLMHYGYLMTQRKVLRGSSLCEPNELAKRIKHRDKGEGSELCIAGIRLPSRSETQHMWINGTTGAGKTVVFSDMLSQIRSLNRRAIVYDIMGVYVARFYRPGKDIILNPFDKRSPGWSPWAECSHSVDYETLAASQIPISPGASNEDPFWKKAARSLYSATLRRLAKAGNTRNVVLLRYLLTADLDKLRALLKDTEAESLVSKDLEKTALSVKAILNDYIKGMRFLRDDNIFSIRDWVRRDDDDSWIFIASRPDQHETLMPLISTWYDTAITEALSLPEDPERRIYFTLDELPTLQYLPSLKKGITLGRQKGLCFMLGTQDLSQLRVNYGADSANSLIGNTNTKLILRTSCDANTISDAFNQAEYQENVESVSYGVSDNRDGVSISKQRTLKNIVLPSELQNLDDLEGYLRVGGPYPITKVALTYVHYDEPNERLVPKEDDIDDLIEHDKYSGIKIVPKAKKKKAGNPVLKDTAQPINKQTEHTADDNYRL